MAAYSPTGHHALLSTRVARTAYACIAGGALLWCSAIVAAPLLYGMSGNAPLGGQLLYLLFHPICHQLDAYSFHLAGARLAVCIRCTAIYVSFALGLLLYPFAPALGRAAERSRALILAAVLPMVMDVGLSWLGVHASTTASRLLTGSLFGLTAAFILLPLALGAAAQIFSSQPSTIHHQRSHYGQPDTTEA